MGYLRGIEENRKQAFSLFLEDWALDIVKRAKLVDFKMKIETNDCRLSFSFIFICLSCMLKKSDVFFSGSLSNLFGVSTIQQWERKVWGGLVKSSK